MFGGGVGQFHIGDLEVLAPGARQRACPFGLRRRQVQPLLPRLLVQRVDFQARHDAAIQQASGFGQFAFGIGLGRRRHAPCAAHFPAALPVCEILDGALRLQQLRQRLAHLHVQLGGVQGVQEPIALHPLSHRDPLVLDGAVEGALTVRVMSASSRPTRPRRRVSGSGRTRCHAFRARWREGRAPGRPGGQGECAECRGGGTDRGSSSPVESRLSH